MRFQGMVVPGASLVEIVTITQKDGTPLEEDNWRRKLFGMVTLCWIAGGFRERGAFFKGNIRMKEGRPVELDLHAGSWCSTTKAQPIEVQPGIFDFETNTSIYRFRILSEEEEQAVCEAVAAVEREQYLRWAMDAPAEEGPVS